MHPIVAIIGRPNVGKSRLFNRLVGTSRAIVSDLPGITRDRHYAPADWAGCEFIAVDTGGLDLGPATDLEGAISRQSLVAVEEADVIVCLFDGQGEPTASDRDVVERLRRSKAKVIYALNKIDDAGHDERLNDFYELGADPMVAISAEHGRGVDDLLDEVVRHFPPEANRPAHVSGGIMAAVVGQPNVGKSTLINRLAGEERVVAHELPGTTRDAIDVDVEFEGKHYVFIDTAGIKRRWGVAERLEKFTAMLSLRVIDRAQVACLLIDGTGGITRQDMHLAGFVYESGKGLIILVNKCDLLKEDWEGREEKLKGRLGALAGAPLFPISALKGTNCLRIFSSIDRLDSALSARVTTSQLNRIVARALGEHHLPAYRGKQVRIYYATQTGTHPPTFALFANYPAAVPYSYRRYLMRCIQDEMGVKNIPVRIVCRKK